MLGDKGREPSREAMRAHDASCRNRQLTALEREVAGAQLLDLAHILEHANSELAQGPADVGELHIPAHALEQREPEGGFETPHHTADRSLGEAERFGGRGDVLALGNREKRVQLVEGDPRSRMPWPRLRRAHRGFSREARVLGGGRWRRRPQAPLRPTRRSSACRCRRRRPVRQVPRTDPTHP